ncbi:MAG: bifunctional (p)ppGpp synthetase/guanosine-3',5'-bis(diphosphate) 3'-pyrophosphohydrolase [Candidatus Staskawiczbacteria bacterium]|nr:bifunctional (p)ppGpp synthetase/guanosine-3',5'-bis(diphosphate) 3'-pyrophosphohydrolase [Candidatus Staskawiczbacteria bacterium]
MQKLVNEVQKIIENSSNPKLIGDAFKFAKEAYKEKKSFSGENYICHTVRVASELDKMGLDPLTVAFGLLHGVMDDMPAPIKKIKLYEVEKRFGREITNLIEKVSDLTKIRYSLAIINLKERKTLTEEKIENLRRMFLAISGDLRVILMELVSRLDGLNSLDGLPEEQQKLYSIETLQIFVPIANRLGLSEIRRNLEDLSFFYLFPKKFKWLRDNIKGEYAQREKYLKKYLPLLKRYFKKERLKFIDINYRAKSYWSTYKKFATHNMDFNKIHDLIAVRVIVRDIKDCYNALGIINKYYKPIPEEMNDYIAKPKPNGYRSLHTTVFSEEDKIVEIQIRTEEMQKEAEYGVYAHWSYKEKINLKNEGEKFKWVNPVRSQTELEKLQKKQTSNGVKEVPEFWKAIKIDFFPDRVFAFTPKGDVINLTKGSTPVDFAYAVHSDIGNHCESAKVGGKITPLSYVIKNGDVVEIITSKNKKPSRDWLRFVKTSFTKSHIKKIIEKNEPNFVFAIPNFIKKTIFEIAERGKKKKEEKKLIKTEGPRQIYLAGQKGMLLHIAKCCNPQPGDKVKAYLAKNRATVLHKFSCSNFQKILEKFPDRIIDASW